MPRSERIQIVSSLRFASSSSGLTLRDDTFLSGTAATGNSSSNRSGRNASEALRVARRIVGPKERMADDKTERERGTKTREW
uniref:Uncharacterized protein n=1 Tax=Vespula pensylvanica TaxID=30213 RepID=A0A834NZ64_VESPE|nr:hypothetical protein H0235_009760 [Vespula pensylvanica]